MFFFFNDTATTEIYTLSLHDALPISTNTFRGYYGQRFTGGEAIQAGFQQFSTSRSRYGGDNDALDRKSTRLNSSHANISYAVFCLKKKKHHLPPALHPPDRSHLHSRP